MKRSLKCFLPLVEAGAGSIITKMGTGLLGMWKQKGEGKRRIRKDKRESKCDQSEFCACMRCHGET